LAAFISSGSARAASTWPCTVAFARFPAALFTAAVFADLFVVFAIFFAAFAADFFAALRGDPLFRLAMDRCG